MSEDPSPENRDQAGAAGDRAARPTLAVRLAERSRQRALRAERLARLRPATGTAAPADEAEAALQEFLRALTGDLPPAAPPPMPAEAAVLAFQRPAVVGGLGTGAETGVETGISDLESLPGVGPNLVWALERAGIACLADLVPLAPAELVRRLGPIGRLVPAAGWIAAARATVPAD